MRTVIACILLCLLLMNVVQTGYRLFLRNLEIQKSPNLKWCPNPKCSVVISTTSKKTSRCPKCETEICNRCNREAHHGRSCAGAFEEEIRGWENASDIQKCRKCQGLVEKIAGCNHMTCSICRYEWCWLCGSAYSTAHFSALNPFGCPGLQDRPRDDWGKCKILLLRLALLRRADRLQAKRVKNGPGEFADAFAVLGGDRDRIAEAQLEGFIEAVAAAAALALVGHQHDGRAGFAHHLREREVARHHAVARVHHEQRQIRLRDRLLALRPHARRDAAGGGFFQPRRIDHRDDVAGDVRFALAPVARQPRQIRDQRRTLSRQPVEKGRFADIGSADDGDDGWHVMSFQARTTRASGAGRDGWGAIAPRRRRCKPGAP